MFGMGGKDKYGDDELIKAVRKRLLSEIAQKGSGGNSQMQKVINNVYGSSAVPDASSGPMGHMGAGAGMVSPGDDPYSYMVDIERENTDNGWKKKVHRYRQPKGEVIQDEKKK